MGNLSFRIEFHGPFHMATGEARRGHDLTVDEHQPLQASSIKGVLRHQARLLSLPEHVVDDVFGHPRHPCPWHFGTPNIDEFYIDDRRRVRISSATGTAVAGALQDQELVWARSATFEISPMVPLPADVAERHQVVLAAAAQSTTSLGADRNRGYGWVTIRRWKDGGVMDLDDTELDLLDSLAAAAPPTP